MKKTFVIMTALALGFGARAQSLEEGIKMYKYERYQSAQKTLTPLAATNAMANYYLGLAQLGTEKVDEAKATFSKYPNDIANMSGLARVAFAQHNPTQGMTLAKAVADKANKKDVQPLRYAADALTYSDGADYQQAITWYKAVLAKNDDPDVHIALGDAFRKVQGGGGEAMSNYEHVTDKDPKNSLALAKIGSLWYDSRTYASAVENYNRAKNADTTNPLPYRDLAHAYQRTGKFDLALQNLQKYMQYSDHSVNDQVNNAELLFEAEHYADAVTAVKQLNAAGVTKPGLYGILGFSQLETGDSSGALQNIRMYVTKQDPAKVTPLDYTYYGRAELKMGMPDSANTHFNKAISIDTASNKSETFRKIAEIFKSAKEWSKAATWYDKLIKANPQTQALDYFWRSVMYFYAKDYANASIATLEFETKYPNEASSTYWRARVAAAVDNEAKDTVAAPLFVKWLDKVGPNYEKKNDMKLAYQYLVLFYYNHGDKANQAKYTALLKVLSPDDELLKQLEEVEKAASAPKKSAAPAKTTKPKK